MPDVEDRIRAFVAVLPPESVARDMERLLDRLRPLARCRWVTRAQLHVTLRFLGELPPSVVDRVRLGLAEVNVEPFEIELNRAGAFPNLDRPRALWLAGDRGMTELTDLARRVDDALFALGIAREERPFKPHLTLARSDGSPPPPSLLEAFRSVPSFSWSCAGFSLMRSRLMPGGAVYTKL